MIGEVAALCAACCWAVGAHMFARFGRGGAVSAGGLNLVKCVTALGLFAATRGLLHGQVVPAVSGQAVRWLALSGVVGLALGDWAYFQALLSIGVRRTLLLLSTAPVFTAVGGALWLGERLSWSDGAAVGAVVVGVGVVVYEQESGGDGPRSSFSGVLSGLGAAVAQAVGSLMSRAGMSGGVSALDAALVRMAAGLAGIVLLAAVTRQIRGSTRVFAQPRLLGAIAASATVTTYMGLWLSQFAIGHASSTAIAATLLATSPLFALPFGRWLSAERMTGRAIGGTALACAGSMLLTLGRS